MGTAVDPGWILDTDYETFSVTYSCENHPFELTHKKTASIDTRDPNPSQETVSIYTGRLSCFETWVGLTWILAVLHSSALAEAAGQMGKMLEHLSQSQPNPCPQADGTTCTHKQYSFLHFPPFQIDKAFEVFESNGLNFDDWYPIVHPDDCVYDRSPSCKDNWE